MDRNRRIFKSEALLKCTVTSAVSRADRTISLRSDWLLKIDASFVALDKKSLEASSNAKKEKIIFNFKFRNYTEIKEIRK